MPLTVPATAEVTPGEEVWVHVRCDNAVIRQEGRRPCGRVLFHVQHDIAAGHIAVRLPCPRCGKLTTVRIGAVD